MLLYFALKVICSEELLAPFLSILTHLCISHTVPCYIFAVLYKSFDFFRSSAGVAWKLEDKTAYILSLRLDLITSWAKTGLDHETFFLCWPGCAPQDSLRSETALRDSSAIRAAHASTPCRDCLQSWSTKCDSPGGRLSWSLPPSWLLKYTLIYAT